MEFCLCDERDDYGLIGSFFGQLVIESTVKSNYI